MVKQVLGAMKRLSACRLCGGGLHIALNLAPMPLVDDYDSGLAAALYPTELMRCGDCGLVQLSIVVPPDVLYGRYSYRTGHSPGLVRHFREYAAEIAAEARLTSASLAVDIGANDGTLLRFIREMSGCRVLGVDPSPADAGDIPMWRRALTPERAGLIVSDHGLADLVTANNVLAHVDDLAGTLRAARKLLKPGGLFVCEVGSLDAMVAGNVWETIYHEHLSYFDTDTLAAALRGAGFWPVMISAIPTHGGSLRAVCRTQITPQQIRGPFHRDLSALSLNVADRRLALRDMGADGALAFGASAKASVILWQTGIRPRAVIDDNPLKQGKSMPGTDIPIVGREALDGTDVLVVLAWNEVDAIVASLPDLRGRILVASPMPYEYRLR